MSYDYSIRELDDWNIKIEKIVQDMGLDCYPQEFEICDYEEMLGYVSYIGMPSHYPHWSFGKSYEKQKKMYNLNLSGLPYEMVINSNPCLAYLMKDNTLLLQILTISHVYGHNDFFKNNRLFKDGTDASNSISMFKNHAERVRDYIADPSIGYSKVENILNSAHALKYNVSRIINEKKLTLSEQRKKIIKGVNQVKPEYSFLDSSNINLEKSPNINKIPLEPEDDLLYFFIEYGNLNTWQRDLLEIVRQESLYFLPQIETKIMNEGFASYFHYKILNNLKLEQGLHIEFLKRHNQVIRPHLGSINPYYVGFKIIEWIDNNLGREKLLEVRSNERDSSFIRKYLNKDLCEEMNLFEYKLQGRDYLISEISDESGWKGIRNYLADTVGISSIPSIKIMEWDQNKNILFLSHIHNGQDLEINYAANTLKHINYLFKGEIRLSTKIDDQVRQLYCDINGKTGFK